MQSQASSINILVILGSIYHLVDILSGPLLIVAVLVWVLRKIVAYRYLRAQPTTILVLTPPAGSEQASYTTEQFHKVVDSLGSARTRYERLIGYHPVFAFELPANYRDGTRFVVRLPSDCAASFEQQLTAYVPALKCQVVTDYLDPLLEQNDQAQILEFHLSRHYLFSLAAHDKLAQHDPMAYITSAMTQLLSDEQIVLQYLVTPRRPRSAIRHGNALHMGKMPNVFAPHRSLPRQIAVTVIALPFRILMQIIWFISSALSPGDNTGDRTGYQSASQYSDDAKELMVAFRNKLSQPLFQVRIRVLVIASDPQRSAQHINSLASALRALNVPARQGLVERSQFPQRSRRPYQLRSFAHRWPTIFLRDSSLLSAAELASLYHFPYGAAHVSEGVVTSLSHTLPVPIGLKSHADDRDFDVVLGINHHHGGSAPIGLTLDERARHMYVIGGTGNGKTTMLQYGIIQDIQNGKGVAVIDPHGDLAETILQHIPKNRIDDVIYFNPHDADYPIGMNLLEIDESLAGIDRLMAQDFVTEALVSVFRKIFSDDNTGGHRIEHALRYAVHTAFTVPDATLFTVRKLLVNNSFRKQVVAKLQDEDLKEFWTQEFAMAGGYQKYKKIDGVTSKIGRFERSVAARRILEQPKSTINFEDIIDNGKILICNLAKGKIGEDTSELFGTTILAKLQLAAYRRIRMPEAERRPFYLYVDEFQNFATPVFVEILSESRKYKLYITMAEQSTAQQDPEIVENILNNAGTVVCFRTSSPEDERYMLHQFQSSVNKGEISSLSAFNFYMRIAAVKAQQPFSGETVLLENTGSEVIAESVVTASRKNYAIKYEEPVKLEKQQDADTSATVRKTAQTKVAKGRRNIKYPKQNRAEQQNMKRDVLLDNDQSGYGQFIDQPNFGLADDDPVAG